MRALLLLLSLLLPAVASATQVQAMDLGELAAESSVAVWATVTGVSAEPIPETPKRTHTRVTLTVRRVLRSDQTGADTVEFTMLGGAVGRYAQVVAGTPAVALGDEVVVLLSRAETGRLRITGFNQGFWKVTRGPFGATVATSDRRGAELIQRTRLGEPRVVPVPSVDARSLDSLLQELTAALAAKDAR